MRRSSRKDTHTHAADEERFRRAYDRPGTTAAHGVGPGVPARPA